MHKYIESLNKVFAGAPNKHEANYRSREILEEMSHDPAFFTTALQKHLQKPDSLNTKHYPVVGIDIELNHLFGLVANCWIPLPDKATDISTKAIHHHGDMLLSTVTAFGPGYEHWTFKRPEPIDEESESYSLRLIERAPHPLHHVAFVDSYVAHLPFYPGSMTITYALWSSKFQSSWKDRVKRVPLLQKNSARLKQLASRAGMARHLDLKVVEYFDFYPTDCGFKGIRERREFERGPNSDYLYSLFHVIQQTGNERVTPLIRRQLEMDQSLENADLLKDLLQRLERGEPIEGRLSATHYGVERANFTRKELEAALAAESANVRSASSTATNAG
ncbi:MAG TPA: hypothetical protein VJT50_00200 [Pyrinomonadaceae bacterium]|nr:hypothetical protein [Pyrinomonadaceae bacterium]